MQRPDSFQLPYVVMRNLPYRSIQDSFEAEQRDGGVLRTGETVWTVEDYRLGRCPRSATAFVDGVGVVALDPRWLAQANILAAEESR